jgi:hypothetical protein
VSLRISRGWRTGAIVCGVVAAILCAATGIGGIALLYLLPALVLVCVLLAGRYPGEAVLARRRPLNRYARRAASSLARTSRSVALVPRGGLLMGFALAVRPPPLRLSA